MSSSYQTIDALSFGVLLIIVFNKYTCTQRQNIMIFMQKKNPRVISRTICSGLPRTANILDPIEISWFGPIFNSSPRLEIAAHILVA